MSARVTKFFILNGKHYNTGDLVGDDDIALESGLSHCLALDAVPEPVVPVIAVPEKKEIEGLVTKKSLTPKKA